MATSYKTPGVYIVEKNAFPSSAVPVATAVPVFIGYTEKAVRNNESLLRLPTKVTSMKEYEEYFGGAFQSTFKISEVAEKAEEIKSTISDKEAFQAKLTAAQNADENFAFVSTLHKTLVTIAAEKDNVEKDRTEAFKAIEKVPQLPAKVEGVQNKVDNKTNDINASNDNSPKPPAEAKPEGEDGSDNNEAKKEGQKSDEKSEPILGVYNDVKAKITEYTNATKEEKPEKAKAVIEIAKNNLDVVANYLSSAWKNVVTSTNDLAVAGQLHTIKLNGKEYSFEVDANKAVYFYNAIRLFYANGGGSCYILAIDTYANKSEQEVKYDDYVNSTFSVFDTLKKEFEPTLVVIPDATLLDDEGYNTLNKQVLSHCSEMGSRFGLFDVKQADVNIINKKGVDTNDIEKNAKDFRSGIGMNNLQYGAAYYPWLKTSVVQQSEINFENLSITNNSSSTTSYLGKLLLDPSKPDSFKGNQAVIQIFAPFEKKELQQLNSAEKNILHQSLVAASPTYVQIMNKIRARLNELPPSSAMAGVYTYIDNSRGVWKAPANVSLNMVNEPSFSVTDENQADLNVDAISGKSINIIRSFPGLGTLVWGARTLDGNSQDWRYINVRRTLIMIEQSLKLATRAYVFEPNDSSTWVTVKSMYDNFLYNLWKQGALFGTTPNEAYNVQIGLGSTMTANDILDGLMRVSVKIAIVRPAEFIEMTFQQQLQQS